MPAEQGITHWYNQIPDLVNGDIPDDYPYTPNDYPFDKMGELHSLLNRLCDEVGSITWEIRNGFVNIIMSDSNRTTYSFGLRTWLTNEREVKRYLREWFPSFNIPYTMGGIANHVLASTPTDRMIRDYVRDYLNSFEHTRVPDTNVIPIDSITNPSPCTGKEEAPYTNYFDVI